MAKLSTGDTTISAAPEERYNLTQIRGIGTIKKQWLRSLGILTLQELALASVGEIEMQLRQAGRTIARAEIENWVQQAQALTVGASEMVNAAVTAMTTSPVVQTVEPVTAVAPDAVLPAPTPMATESAAPTVFAEDSDRWQTVASFNVEFQSKLGGEQTQQRTLIRQLSLDHPTGALEQIPQWFLEQLGAGDPIQTKEPVVLEITQLRVRPARRQATPIVIDKAQRRFPGSLTTGEPFALEAYLQFIGLSANLAQQQIVYRAQCQAHNRSTGATIQLGDTIANVPANDQSSYTVLFPDVSLTQPGTYRLKVLVTVQNAPATPAYFKVPLVQVI